MNPQDIATYEKICGISKIPGFKCQPTLKKNRNDNFQ